VPEVAVEYHFSLRGRTFMSFGVHYSRGVNNVYEGEVEVQKANGEILTQSYSRPFSSFGLSFGISLQ